MADKIVVIGAGTMGSGIAQVAAEGGFNVTIVDTSAEFLYRGLGNIKTFIGRESHQGHAYTGTGRRHHFADRLVVRYGRSGQGGDHGS